VIAGLATWFALAAPLHAKPVDLNVPAQSADRALLAFSKQANIEVLFSYDELRKVQAQEVIGRFEPEDAIARLLRNTGFAAQRTTETKFIIKRISAVTGSITGQLVRPDGTPVRGAQIAIAHTPHGTITNDNGEYEFTGIAPGGYRLFATLDGYQNLQIVNAIVKPDRVLELGPRTMRQTSEPARLDPFVVEGKSARPWRLNQSETEMLPRTAAGNLDLSRTEDDALPYTIYNREQITRSGVINLNEFLQRELLDTDAANLPPEQDAGAEAFAGSSNLRLRGFDADSTVVLVNGRRMPEMLTNIIPQGSTTLPPDVNFIPLSLVQQIQVLPTSASALYSGNAVGGVINIVLRPDVDADATEVTGTYTNALRHFDAPQSSISLLHARALFGGKLRVRFNISVTEATPPTEAELGYHRAHAPSQATYPLDAQIHRATPNIQSADGTPLFGPGTSSVTSVAPGADGTGGLAAFAGRDGVRNFDLFKSPGDLAVSHESSDYPYGRRQRRVAYYGSAVSDPFPWLQIGADINYAHTVVNRGYDVPTADLLLAGTSALNPFKKDVIVSLNESVPQLGQDYNEARLDFASGVIGVMVKLPADWRLSADAQYAHNIVKYRALAGADPDRWQQLVDTGRYNPLRDTQKFGPPQEFYDRVLIYRGGRGRFITLGDYDTLDLAGRVTNETLRLPTGLSTVNIGGDYRRNHLNPFFEDHRYGDGTLAESDTIEWSGRTIGRYSAFGELQTPIVPTRWLPSWIKKADVDAAVRYVVSSNAHESNVAPTIATKIDFAGGISFRGSVTTSNRVPTPQLSRQVFAPGGPPAGIDLEQITDPLRGETYDVQVTELVNPDLRPEEAVTQTAGLIFQTGKKHRIRAALDFVDTQKVNELAFLNEQAVVNLEAILPGQVSRAPLSPGDPHRAGQILAVVTGTTNLSRRHSENWNASFDYAGKDFFNGTLEAYARLLYFQSYRVRSAPTSGSIDELHHPDGAVSGLLRYRANFGVGWFNHDFGFGMDGRYFHRRTLPIWEWPAQGRRSIAPFWELDGYTQVDLNRWLPWKDKRYGLRAQFRVNNLFLFDYPKYVNGPAASNVQPYGDWRGRTYSVSVTATF
jgi:iron complex outermembrane recepter protein